MVDSDVGNSPEFRLDEIEPVVAILDAGAQYVDMIKKACERQGFPSEVVPIETDFDEIEAKYKAVVVSGGPGNTHSEGAPMPDPRLWDSDMPTLGICYGMQAMALANGGHVADRGFRNDSRQVTNLDVDNPLFDQLAPEQTALFTHGDFVEQVPESYKVIGKHIMVEKFEDDTEIEHHVISAITDGGNKIGVQFHPEVFDDTPQGYEMFDNFFSNVAELEPNLDFLSGEVERNIEAGRQRIRERVGDEQHVIAFVSGGVDSVTAVALAAQEIEPERMHMYYIDNGYMREEDDGVIEILKSAGFDVNIIEAEDYFENAFAEFDGETVGPLIETHHPQYKRRIIGEAFIDIQDQIVAELGFTQDQVVLLQGTNAADRIESGHSKGGSDTEQIKEHHNLVQRARDLNPLEPLDDFFKDEIRSMAVWLGLPPELAFRQPFPGPGLAIRILGMEDGAFETPDLQHQAQIAQRIQRFNAERDLRLSSKLLPVRSVGVGGDSRSHIAAVAVEGEITSENLIQLSNTVTSEFKGIANRVVHKLGGGPLESLSPVATRADKQVKQTLRHADLIVFEEMRRLGILTDIEQLPVVLLPLGSNGERSIVLRPVKTKTFMTAQAMLPDTHLPREFFESVTQRVLQEVDGISHVFLDVTNKPPGTTEWE